MSHSAGWNYPSSKSNFTINYPVDQTARPATGTSLLQDGEIKTLLRPVSHLT